MTKTEDVWGGDQNQTTVTTQPPEPSEVIQKQIRDITRENLQRANMPGGEGPCDFKASVADAVAAIEKQLTNDINEMWALRRKVEATVPQTKAEARANTAVYERIGKHIFDLQQGSRAPVVNMNAVLDAEFNHNANAATKRALEITKLKIVRKVILDLREDVFAPILSHSLSRLPKVHKNIARTPREVLLADSGCRDQLNALLWAAADAQIKKLELFPVTNISDRIIELKQQIDGSKNADEIEQVQAELAKLRSPEAEHIANLRRREITPLVEFSKETTNRLIQWAIASLESCHAEAVRFERAMFADLSLPHEVTVVSRRYTQAIAELRQLSTPLRVLNWFGMPSLTHVAEQLDKTTE